MGIEGKKILNIKPAVYDKPIDNITLKSEKLKAIPLRSEIRKGCPFLQVLFKKVLEVLATEKAMAPHSSTLAWKIPWTEEPSRLQSMGSLRVRHD